MNVRCIGSIGRVRCLVSLVVILFSSWLFVGCMSCGVGVLVVVIVLIFL